MELFGTAGIRGPIDEVVTPRLALDVGIAVGALVRTGELSGADSIAIGRDGRTSGPSLAAAVESGVLAAGVDVERVGVVPTPALAYASRGRSGIMLTASHNPPADNGIKVFSDGEEVDRGVEGTIEQLVERRRNGSSDATSHGGSSSGETGLFPGTSVQADWSEWGRSTNGEILGGYRRAVQTYAEGVGEPPTDLGIAVDCGNGMGSLATPAVLSSLGADVITLNGNVDGHFPGRPSKPTPETIGDLRRFVADSPDVDLGIAHDGDADRIVVVDDSGEVIHEDTIVAILAGEYVRGSRADDPVVVTTPNASARIDDRVRAAGGRVERVRLGALHEGIAAAEADGGSVVFAAEPWKHIHTAFGGWIDGVASAAVLTRLVAATDLETLRDPVQERPYRKVSVDCPESKKEPAMADLTASLPEAFPEADLDTEHGIRLELPDGSWLLVRPSGTEPYLRLYAESDAVDELAATARDRIETAVEAADTTATGEKSG